ncbi:YhgE/Pip domain-containing protein [Gordonia hydrophobica]|uniref:DUF3533 domain-containing protein n=1 Tax=Gordonia hydrophobica TaxID=40516 RepID=A0ABZ2TZR4_9ACTN|nr:DUF3533 domain-containing protein [Gordonia hydrophobica]MBM7369408.1 YhgE/Pip-like protein [Gordonia hydrophobica]
MSDFDDVDTDVDDTPATERTRPLRSWRFWAGPIIVVTVVMSAMAALYLSSILDPIRSLNSFPIAVVNEDTGATDPTGKPVNLADEITAAVDAKVDPDQVDLEYLSWDETVERMRDGRLYGAIRVPADFSAKTMALAQSSLTTTSTEQPTITVWTNPRSATMGSSLVTSLSGEVLAEMNKNVGTKITEAVNQSAAQQNPAAQVSGAAAVTLATPIQIVHAQFEPLPSGSGLGLAAFYFALLVLLGGFTGAMLVNTLIDGSLGFIASEIGPRIVVRKPQGLNRIEVLAIKWAVMIGTALVLSTAYVGVGAALDMHIDHPWILWGYSALAISAVGVTALSIISAFGGIGLLINMFVFVFLGLPSAGATIPLEATPQFFAWLSSFEPLHQVYVGIRAIVFFDARGAAGLTHAVIMTIIGLLIGAAVGLGTAYYYERRGLPRLGLQELAKDSRGESAAVEG